MLTESDARELEAALKTTEGREQIAQTMYEPFKKGRDYVAIGRQCFAVDHLPAGAPSWYDLDPQFTAAVVGAKGGVNFSEIEATRINVDPQILAVYPKVHALDVAVRRFNILDREQERAQHEMAKPTSGHVKATDLLETPKANCTVDLNGENQFDVPMDNQQGLVKCVICGKLAVSLQSHVTTHGLSPKQYKTTYNASLVGKAHGRITKRSLATRKKRYGDYISPVSRANGRKRIAELSAAGLFSLQIPANLKKVHAIMREKLGGENAMQIPSIAAKNHSHRHSKPNKYERWVLDNVSNFKFVGNFKLKVKHPVTGRVKYPDFVFRTAILEVFGDFWHSRKFKGEDRPTHENTIRAFYNDCGYTCLIVWASEIQKNPEATKQKITSFLRDYQVAAEKSVIV